MILVSYETTNWGPHRHQRVDFPPGAKTVALCAENDQGKSWIVRGIGFCLSIGRNEYGDQSAIHDGQAESRHTLVIEHAGERHTIEKIVRGKKSEDEGTQTLIDGKIVDRAGYERFYAETLGLPHPSIWLPITIAMQNETDFHLRRKKSEREEALRAACQLTRIDSWKDALQARTNEEDKTLLAQEAGLKSRQEALAAERESLRQESETLKSNLAGFEQPLGAGGPKLEAILKTVAEFDEKVASGKKAALEAGNLKRELDLAKAAGERAEALLAKSPGAAPEEEARTAERLETLQNEWEAREKRDLAAKLAERAKKSAGKTRELSGLATAPEAAVLDSLESDLSEIGKKTALAEEKERETLEALAPVAGEAAQPLPAGAPADWETKAAEQAAAASGLASESEAISKAGTALETALAQTRRLCPDQAGETADLQTLRKILEKTLEDCSESGQGPIGSAESHRLLGRVLSHWEGHPHDDCPICGSSLASLPTFQNPKARKAVLASLQTEIDAAGNLAERRRNATLSLQAIGEAIAHEASLKSLLGDKWADWRLICEERSKKAFALDARAKALAQAAKNAAAAQSCRQAAKALAAGLAAKLPQAAGLDPENTGAFVKSLREASAKRAILEAELSSLARESSLLEEAHARLANAGEPSDDPEVARLDAPALKSALEQTKTKVRTLRETRTAHAALEREVATLKTKLESAEAAFKAADLENARLAEAVASGCGMPKAPGLETLGWPASAEHWRAVSQKAATARAQLEPLPAKLAAKEAEILEAFKGLEAVARAAAKAAAARRLVAFLDYKNAPRKLLGKICERLFDATNRIAQTLKADIRLKVGKNLDFLTIQHRAGRLIEQKTERLGFGKGAVLGICFRLACQKLLLPETGFLILDEPTANVDIKRKDALKTFLQNLGEESGTKTGQVILIEHDLNVIELCQAKIQIGETAVETGEPIP